VLHRAANKSASALPGAPLGTPATGIADGSSPGGRSGGCCARSARPGQPLPAPGVSPPPPPSPWLPLGETGIRASCRQPFLARFAALPSMRSHRGRDAQHLPVPPAPTSPPVPPGGCPAKAKVLLEAARLQVFQAASEPFP